jgi:hypothetical protein
MITTPGSRGPFHNISNQTNLDPPSVIVTTESLKPKPKRGRPRKTEGKTISTTSNLPSVPTHVSGEPAPKKRKTVKSKKIIDNETVELQKRNNKAKKLESSKVKAAVLESARLASQLLLEDDRMCMRNT